MILCLGLLRNKVFWANYAGDWGIASVFPGDACMYAYDGVSCMVTIWRNSRQSLCIHRLAEGDKVKQGCPVLVFSPLISMIIYRFCFMTMHLTRGEVGIIGLSLRFDSFGKGVQLLLYADDDLMASMQFH